MTERLTELSNAKLRALAASLRSGPLALGISLGIVQQIAGTDAQGIKNCLDSLLKTGMSPNHIATLVETLILLRERTVTLDQVLELVLSGPEVVGLPTSDTSATMQTLIEDAEREILLVGYAVHRTRGIFERLARRMNEIPGLCVTFCLDISRNYGDTSIDSEIVKRFGIEFKEKHWPWSPLPTLYYDPRSLSDNLEQRSSLHAKCVVVDRKSALITSANFTEAAQQRNIEVGVLVRHAPMAERIARYFDGLKDKQLLTLVSWGSRIRQ